MKNKLLWLYNQVVVVVWTVRREASWCMKIKGGWTHHAWATLEKLWEKINTIFIPMLLQNLKKTADYSEKTEMCENVRYQSSMICQIRIFRWFSCYFLVSESFATHSWEQSFTTWLISSCWGSPWRHPCSCRRWGARRHPWSRHGSSWPRQSCWGWW